MLASIVVTSFLKLYEYLYIWLFLLQNMFEIATVYASISIRCCNVRTSACLIISQFICGIYRGNSLHRIWRNCRCISIHGIFQCSHWRKTLRLLRARPSYQGTACSRSTHRFGKISSPTFVTFSSLFSVPDIHLAGNISSYEF